MFPSNRSRALVAAGLLGLLGGCSAADRDPQLVRIGHFPNVTHLHALVARALPAGDPASIESQLGPGMRVEWFAYNAGPSAMEALLAGSIDAAYVGPNPALNAHVRSGGRDVRVLCAATRGGAALVVRKDAGIKTPADFRGRRIATPQLGNTQDVACRTWLRQQGFEVTPTGGDVQVIPTANPDQLALFQKGELDAAWTVEPWVTRLEQEGGGEIWLEDQESLTTLLVVSARFLEEQPEMAQRLLAAHRAVGGWIRAQPQRAKELVRNELAELTSRPMSQDLIDRCFPRLDLSDRIAEEDVLVLARDAHSVGFLKEVPDLSMLVVRK